MKNEIENKNSTEQEIISKEEQAVLEKITGGKWKKYGRVAMAALGVLPWVGSIFGAAASLSSENDHGETNQWLFLWIKEHEKKLKEFGLTLNSMFAKFESFGERIKDRIESEEYIGLVHKTFKIWDQAETLEKKEMLRKLITNAGGITVAEDDLVRMFLEWIEKYNELHFKVIAEVYRKPKITKKEIWIAIKGEIPKDSSDDADLFKLLIDDLTIGRVIRQPRTQNHLGQWEKKTPIQKGYTSHVMESPFNDDQEVLTELGEGFVKYVMNELTPQIENK